MSKLGIAKLVVEIAEVASRAYANVTDKLIAKEKLSVDEFKNQEITRLKDEIIRLQKDAEIKELKKRIEQLENEGKKQDGT